MKKPPSKIIGLCAGGHCRSLLTALSAMKVRVFGLLDDGMPWRHHVPIEGVRVIGPLVKLATLGRGRYFVGLGAKDAAGCAQRRALWNLPKEHWQPLTIIHPSAVIHPSAHVGPGAQILALAHLGPGVVVDRNAVINTLANIEHDSRVSAHAFIGPGAILCGDVEVGLEAFIGAGAILLPGIQVGAGATVGAGAVVTRHVKEGERVVGLVQASKQR